MAPLSEAHRSVISTLVMVAEQTLEIASLRALGVGEGVTPAVAVKDEVPGVVAADGGTLFLDEIGDLPLDLQPKLLRFLENRETMPLGETHPVAVDVRVVAATHKDLADLVRQGLFREDLFFRLQVVPVHLPPLRERREDIVPLVKHFLASLTPDGEAPPRLSPGVIALLLEYDWPGNVREVRNVVERALAYQPVPRVLGADQLHPPPQGSGRPGNRAPASRQPA